MNPETYAVEAQVQRHHWWFAGRRRLLGRLLHDLSPRPAWRVLEVGVGTGANLDALSNLSVRQLVACDFSHEALRYAKEREQAIFLRADACCLPFSACSFDLVLAADVIEHLTQDDAALIEFVRVLKPDGHLVLTVPAFPSLWGPQDIVAHHLRRYRRTALVELVRRSGLRIRECFHFNYLLFIPIWVARKLLLVTRMRVSSENQINTSGLNRLLKHVFFFDVDTAARIHAPFGVSLCVVATKPLERA